MLTNELYATGTHIVQAKMDPVHEDRRVDVRVTVASEAFLIGSFKNISSGTSYSCCLI